MNFFDLVFQLIFGRRGAPAATPRGDGTAPPQPSNDAPQQPAPAPNQTQEAAPEEPIAPPEPRTYPDLPAQAHEDLTPPAPAVPMPAPKPEWPSANFPLDELCASSTATRHRIDNSAPAEIAERLQFTAMQMEKVRAILGNKPIRVSSGYRCVALNDLLGSERSSAHIQGYAVDFTCRSFGSPYQICMALKDHPIMAEVDQLIHEYGGWVHISFDPNRLRRQAFTLYHGGSSASIVPLDQDGKLVA